MKDLTLLLLTPETTKEELVVALNEAQDLISFDKLFFKKVARNAGDKDAKRNDLDENLTYIIDTFDTNPATVINAFNKQIAFRIGLNEIGDKLKNKVLNLLIETAINAYGELIAKGMTREEATAMVLGENESEENQNEV